MQKLILALSLTFIVSGALAQDEKEKEKKSFNKENFFTGGSLTASFFNGATVLGLSPYFGYSFNKYMDAAVSINFTYTSQRDYAEYGDKARQTVYGPGAFLRLYPVKFLFGQAQYEHSFIRFKYIPAANGSFLPSVSNIDANSLLLGGGYTSGREEGSNTFYYFSILWDVAGVAKSPYVDGLGRNFPVIRAGFNIGLFQGKRRR